jgi:hypothetical protein
MLRVRGFSRVRRDRGGIDRRRSFPRCLRSRPISSLATTPLWRRTGFRVTTGGSPAVAGLPPGLLRQVRARVARARACARVPAKLREKGQADWMRKQAVDAVRLYLFLGEAGSEHPAGRRSDARAAEVGAGRRPAARVSAQSAGWSAVQPAAWPEARAAPASPPWGRGQWSPGARPSRFVASRWSSRGHDAWRRARRHKSPCTGARRGRCAAPESAHRGAATCSAGVVDADRRSRSERLARAGRPAHGGCSGPP